MFLWLLQNEVMKEHVKDYNRYVPKKNEMWLGKMEAKAKAGKYDSTNAFRADIEQIGVNARTYNSQGKFKFPGMELAGCDWAHAQCLHAERIHSSQIYLAGLICSATHSWEQCSLRTWVCCICRCHAIRRYIGRCGRRRA